MATLNVAFHVPEWVVVGLAAVVAGSCSVPPRNAGVLPAQPSAVVPAQPTCPPADTTRYIIGGDSRNDSAHVAPWAFTEAKARCAAAFFFLGDMELTPKWDATFQQKIEALKPVPFYPTIGNHEVVIFGTQTNVARQSERWLDPDQIDENIAHFSERFLQAPNAPLSRARLRAQVAYSANVQAVHWISLDNVSQAGFGREQLAWLEADLKAATNDPVKRWIVIGMHNALYDNGITSHAMGDPKEHNAPSEQAAAIRDSKRALDLFKKYRVALIVASHEHLYAKLDPLKSAGIPSYITGGMGAPLKSPELPNTKAQHHILQLDVTSAGLTVTPIWFDAPQSVSTGDDDDDKVLRLRSRHPRTP